MRVLSLFDGISGGRMALERIGVKVEKYYASEIDKYAISIAKKNYPDIVHVGDVTKLDGKELNIDLLIGGSPCQGFSYAGKQLNFEDPRSKLFFEFVRLMKVTMPQYFFLENVKMKKESQDIITEHLGVEPIEINSALVSAQNRKRLYWTNIPGVTQPEDRGIVLKDVLEKNPEGFDHTEKAIEYMNRATKDGRTHWDFAHHADSAKDKSPKLVANLYKGVPYNVLIDRESNLYLNETQLSKLQKSDSKGTGSTKILAHRKGFRRNTQVFDPDYKTECLDTSQGGGRQPHTVDVYGVRKLTPVECERLQTVKDNYTKFGIDEKGKEVKISNTQRYKALGNGWTIDVIAHIFKGMKL